jgi:5-hydroxyisourate hydrolase-like protein (transthyretin family)
MAGGVSRIALGLGMAGALCVCAWGQAASSTVTSRTAGSGIISGVVVSARSGQPLSNASVTLAFPEDRTPMAECVTDAEGRFAFATAAYDEHEQGSTAIVTGPELVSTGLRFVLQPEASIYGTVTEDSGDPVPQARVALYWMHSEGAPGGNGRAESVQQSTADEAGYYEFPSLRPGRYYLTVNGKPWYATQPASKPESSNAGHPSSPLDVAYPVTYYPDATDSAYATPIEVTAGERIPINLTLHPVPAIHITVRVPFSRGAPAGMVQLERNVFGTSDAVDAPFTLSVPDSRGSPGQVATFEFSGIAPAQYDFRFSGTDGQVSRESSMSLTSDQTIEVSSAAPLTPVRGKVILPAGEPGQSGPQGDRQRRGRSSSGAPPVRNRLLRLTALQGGDQISTPIDTTGAFSLDGARPGTYELSILSDGNPMTVTQLSATGAAVEGRRLRIGGEPVVLSVRFAENDSTLHGFAKLNGKPTGGVFLELIPMDGHGPVLRSPALQTNQSDSDGSFDFPHVMPGPYTLVAIEEGWTLDWLNAEALKPYLARGLKVTVPPGKGDLVLKDAVDVQAK